MNVIDIMPMETDTIEFAAPWRRLVFCHIYTMMAGMNRVISYEDQAPEPFLPDRKAAYDKPRKKTVTTWWPKNDFTTREWWYGNASEYAMEHRNRVEVGL
jgi:hypothetical protein